MSDAPIPFLDVTRQPEDVSRRLEDAAARVLRSGRYINGPDVAAFETECATELGVAQAIGVSSGSDALLVILMALGIGPGDEVIVPSYTFFATAGAVARLGATPIFVDSDASTLNIDVAAAARARTAKTKLVIPVHLFGLPADMDGLAAALPDLPVLEDAAQAFGARRDGRAVGSVGIAGAFSFFPSKNLGGFGDGGLVSTNDDALGERIRVLRAHGSAPKYHHALVGETSDWIHSKRRCSAFDWVISQPSSRGGARTPRHTTRRSGAWRVFGSLHLTRPIRTTNTSSASATRARETGPGNA